MGSDNVTKNKSVYLFVRKGSICCLYVRECLRCGHEFKTKNYRRKYCSHSCCSYVAMKNWQQRNPDKVQASNRLKNYSLRRRLLTYLGNKCVVCGETDWMVLQVNHINGGGVQDHRTVGAEKIYRQILAGEREGIFDLRCANCNMRYEYEQRRRWAPKDEYISHFGGE